MEIKGYELEMTCSACPEQYDVFKDGRQVGYLRLRHGYFTVDYPDCGDEQLLCERPQGDGVFYDNERIGFLTKAIDAIEKRIRVGG